jgi:sugar-specific transcriptional regulator TrmB
VDVVEELRRLGFTQHEAIVYIYLLRRPMATGYEIAKGAGLPRANVYQALETLLAKQAVTADGASPTRYVAVPHDQLLTRIRRETEARCARVARELAAVAQRDNTVEHFWTLRSAEAVRHRALELIATAQERVVISLWAEDLPDFREELRAAHARGATVIINLFGEAEADFAQVYRHEDSSKVVGGRLITLAVDFTSALTGSLDPPGGGVYTQNTTLVQLIEKLIRDESYLAEIYAAFREQLEARYGPHLVARPPPQLPRDQAERLITIVSFSSGGARPPEREPQHTERSRPDEEQ